MPNSFSGSLLLSVTALDLLTPPYSGGPSLSRLLPVALNPSGNTPPTLSGFLGGIITPTARTIQIAHATDPFQDSSNQPYSPGFTPGGSYVKVLYFINTDPTQTATMKRASSNGFPFIDTAGAGIPVEPMLGNGMGTVFLLFPVGLGPLTNGANDGITIAVSGAFSAGSFEVGVLYGPQP